MALTFEDMRLEVKARGPRFLSDTRANRFVNQAYQELCEFTRWPFLEATTTGAAPLSVTNLGAVASVVDTDRDVKLHYIDRRSLVDMYKDLATTGEPRWYYIEGGNSIKTYPVGGTLSVRYWKVPTELTSDVDEPVVPDRFRNVIVDLAVRRALMEAGSFDAAAAVQADADRSIGYMAQSLLAQQHDGHDFILDVGDLWDW